MLKSVQEVMGSLTAYGEFHANGPQSVWTLWFSGQQVKLFIKIVCIETQSVRPFLCCSLPSERGREGGRERGRAVLDTASGSSDATRKNPTQNALTRSDLRSDGAVRSWIRNRADAG